MIGEGRQLSQIPEKNRDVELELAYKPWSLTIAEGRGQLDIFGVTLGVTLGVLLELPP